MYDARSVANAVLERAWDRGVEVTQLDIQKICYFLHGHHLRDHQKPLISTEFEAWEYGPVQRSLRDAFRHFRDQPIEAKARAFDPIRRQHKDLPVIKDNSAIETIETHLDKYLGLSSFALVDITHKSDTPWSITMRNAQSKVNLGMRISNTTIAENFEGIEHA